MRTFVDIRGPGLRHSLKNENIFTYRLIHASKAMKIFSKARLLSDCQTNLQDGINYLR